MHASRNINVFWRSCDCASWQISYNKPTRCTNFSNLFWNEIYMFRTVPLSIIRSLALYTKQWYVSYRFAESLRAGSESQQNSMTYNIAVCTVKNFSWLTVELSETYRVSFQNKFEKLVHLIGLLLETFMC
jgi:hypothetical protein